MMVDGCCGLCVGEIYIMREVRVGEGGREGGVHDDE